MKKFLYLFLCLLLFSISGCASCRNDIKHMKSSWVGLDRHIILYDANGKVIREWTTTSKVEDKGGTVWFLVEGKAYTVSGTFVVEEK